MKYSVSFLLLLAIASNCNGQNEAPARRPPSRQPITPGNPSGPAPRPVPNQPSQPSAPAGPPNRQQNPRVPPTTNNRAPQTPQAPGTPPNRQQTRPSPPGAGGSAPTRAPTVNNPGVNSQRPTAPPSSGNNGNNNGNGNGNNNNPTTVRTTVRPGQTTPRPTDNPSVQNPIPTGRPETFPTAPNIAPIPPVHFPDPNVPQFPQQPNFPGGRVGEGRMDPRCPRNADPRNPVQFPHEANCASFYRCGENGFAFEHRCPDGLHWNPTRNFCDLPGNAGCLSGSPIVRPQPIPPQNNWNNQPRFNPHPGYEHPIVIPMAPRT